MNPVERHARYRAPSGSGDKLVLPSWNDLGELLAANAQWRSRVSIDVAGQPLAAFADEARREILARARQYVGDYADMGGSPTDAANRPLIVTGHQPELVHPGVWVKNFAAGALAARHAAVACNLIIDADVCRGMSTWVPSGNVDRPRLASVALDRPAGEAPWEERRIVDQDYWGAFPDRVRQASGSLLSGSMMLDSWWPIAVERARATGRAGLGLAQAQHRAEIGWNTCNLELPQSALCQSRAFRRFVLHVIAELPRFVEAHNKALGAYRRANRIRNHAHPAPNLSQDGPWLEAPFWIWSRSDPRRRPLMVRRDGSRWLLSDRRNLERALPADDQSGALERLAEWEAAGVKLRSRALATTMFARIALADLFIHGIGGAKYDEATDAICERFFGTAPPPFATISGTLRLPIDHPPDGQEAVRELRSLLRELEFHPERRLRTTATRAADPLDAQQAVEEKYRWIAVSSTPENAAARHRGIVEANRRLRALLDGQRDAAEAQLAAAVDRSRANRILDSREYAFCIFPVEMLKQFLLDFP